MRFTGSQKSKIKPAYKTMWFNLAVTVILSTIKDAVKNAERKAQIKRAMLKIAKNILALYSDDSDFIKLINE